LTHGHPGVKLTTRKGGVMRILRVVKPAYRGAQRVLGEVLASVSASSGRAAAKNLFHAHWSGSPEWFDGRLAILYPDKWMSDLSPVVHANIVEKLPLGGTLLDLCGGDGHLPYYEYSRRASKVVSVDYDITAHRHAVKHHSRPNIEYVPGRALDFTAHPESFDVVACRGAIEHFTQPDQQKIFRSALAMLKPGGWFCGDTAANKKGAQALLSHHENEWEDEAEMRRELEHVFTEVHTKTFNSVERASGSTIRHTLLWQCRKPTA
jgi:SAM-dependent methyltransferase